MKVKKINFFLRAAVFACLLFPAAIFSEDISTQKVSNSTETDQSETVPAAAESDDALFSDDDLFSGAEPMISDAETEKAEKAEKKSSATISVQKAGLLLTTEKLRFGGSIDTGLDLIYGWIDPFKKQDNQKNYFLNPKVQRLETHINATLFFDVRPTSNTKIYGKFAFGFPFTKDLGGAISLASLPLLPPGAPPAIPIQVSGSPNIRITELYTDFAIKDIAFFRFGKHAVKWGVGYFYSPADVISLSAIDPLKPEAEREGPVSLRTHLIFPGTQHNFWLYVLPDTQGFRPEKTAAALKAEFLVKNWELGLSAWYQHERAPRFIFTATGSIAGKVGVFSEGVFVWGSDYTYHKTDAALSAYTEKNKAFFQATAGLMYTYIKSHTTIAAQYFYNGLGYLNPKPLLKSLKPEFEKLQSGGPPNILPSPQLIALGHLGEMNGTFGQHYIALVLSQNKIGTEKLGATLFAQYGFSELAGLVKFSINWNIVNELRLSSGVTLFFGSSLQESAAWNLALKFGGGKF